MGTRRRVCLWWQRGRHDYVVEPPNWKPKDGTMCFAHKSDMIPFAQAARLILKEKPNSRRYA